MRSLRLNVLTWGSGILMSFTGALMLVAPHQFINASSSLSEHALIGWGLIFLAVGEGLVGSLIFPVGNMIKTLFSFLGAVLTLLLSAYIWLGGVWILALNIASLGLGLLVIVVLQLLPGVQEHKPGSPIKTDYIAFLLGLNAVSSGIGLLLSGTGIIKSLAPGLAQTGSIVFGLVFLFTGGWLAGFQGWSFFDPISQERNESRNLWLNRLPEYACGIAFGAFWLVWAIPSQGWMAIEYFGGAALILILLPWLGPALEGTNIILLKNRIAYLLAIVACLPVILTTTWVSSHQETTIRSTSLDYQQNLAIDLAREIGKDISLRKAALQSLAARPGLLNYNQEDQRQILETFGLVYPDISSLALYDSNGTQLVTTEAGQAGRNLEGDPGFETLIGTRRDVVQVLYTPEMKQPVIEFLVPILDKQDSIAGMIGFHLIPEEIIDFPSELLSRDTTQPTYMIDGLGRAILHPDRKLASSFADLRNSPPVQAFLSDSKGQGQTEYLSHSGQMLSGYARISGMDWGVITERPSEQALAGVWADRNLAYGIVIGTLLLAILAGPVLARQLTAPLQALAQNAQAMAADGLVQALPHTGIVEVNWLAEALENLRTRLSDRTAERELALFELKISNEELEGRVRQRTVELEKQHGLLQAIFDSDPGGMALITGPVMTIEAANPAYRLLTPHPEGNPVGCKYNDVWPEENGFQVNALLQKVLDGGDNIHSDRHIMKTKNGPTRYFILNIKSIRWGEQPAALIILWETTRQEKAQQELKRTLIALKESEQRFRMMGETLPYGVWLDNPEGQAIYASQSFLDLIDMSLDEVKGFGWARRLPEDEVKPVMESWMSSVRDGEDWDTELHLLGGDGRYHTVLSRGKPVRDENGNITCWVGINLDIDSRKQMEANLAYQALLLENVHDAIWATDAGLHITSWNRACEELYGWSASEAMGQSVYDLLRPAGSGSADPQRILETLSSTGYFREDLSQHRKDSSLVYVDATIIVLRDTQGQVTGHLGANHDVTARKQTELALERSERRFRTVLELLPIGVWLTDEKGEINYGNPSGQQIWAGASYVGIKDFGKYKAWWADTGKPLAPEDWAVARVFSRGETSLGEELEIECFDGTHKFILNSAVPIFDETGKIQGAVTLNQDISERKQAEEAIRIYMRKLEQSNRDLRDFAFVASHDLQEPLRKIRSFGDRLRQRYSVSLGEDGTDWLGRMTNASQRMQAMIDALLNYSRINTRALPFRSVDLNQIAAEVLSDLEARLESTGGKVELGGLPSIDADPVQMHQLLQNLISNGLKFHRPGVPPVVKVFARTDTKSEIELVVEDYGIGFDMQYNERIFQPFQRLHGRSEYDGSGMGLPICRKIAERHGGTIIAESVPGQGSRFIFRVPVKQETETED